MDVTELLDAGLHRVFGNRDAVSRRQAIDEIYTDDVRFEEPEGVSVGRDALEGRAAALIDDAPEAFGFHEEGARYVGPESGAQAWAFGPEGAPVVRGIDVITVRDGRIAVLRTILAAA